MKKKGLLLILLCIICLGLVGCGGGDKSEKLIKQVESELNALYDGKVNCRIGPGNETSYMVNVWSNEVVDKEIFVDCMNIVEDTASSQKEELYGIDVALGFEEYDNQIIHLSSYSYKGDMYTIRYGDKSVEAPKEHLESNLETFISEIKELIDLSIEEYGSEHIQYIDEMQEPDNRVGYIIDIRSSLRWNDMERDDQIQFVQECVELCETMAKEGNYSVENMTIIGFLYNEDKAFVYNKDADVFDICVEGTLAEALGGNSIAE